MPEAPPGGSPELTGGPGRSLKVMGRALEAPWVAPRGARELLGGSWAGPGWLLGHSEALLTIGVSIWEVSGALRKRQKIVREHFFEFPGGQIVIFPRFRACPLCEFEAALVCSWAVLGGSRAAPEAPKLVLGGPRGVPEKRVPLPEGSRGLPGCPKRRFGPVVFFTEVPETLRI